MAVKYWENLAGWMENTGCCKTLSTVEMQDEFMESSFNGELQNIMILPLSKISQAGKSPPGDIN